MKKLITILFLLIALFAHSQYNPSIHVVVNDAIAQNQAAPLDARSQFWDGINFKWRDYQSTAEAIATLNQSKFRFSHFPVWIHSGGTLSGGVWTGGITLEYYWKDGLLDANLVYKPYFGGANSGLDTLNNQVVLGGQSLLRNTTIDGNSRAYNLFMQNLNLFKLDATGVLMTSSPGLFTISAATPTLSNANLSVTPSQAALLAGQTGGKMITSLTDTSVRVQAKYIVIGDSSGGVLDNQNMYMLGYRGSDSNRVAGWDVNGRIVPRYKTNGTILGSGTAGTIPYFQTTTKLGSAPIVNDTTNAQIKFNVPILINNTGASIFDKGTTAQRPGSPVAGMVRFNTDSAGYEQYTGSTWVKLGSGGSGGGSDSAVLGQSGISKTTSGTNIILKADTGLLATQYGVGLKQSQLNGTGYLKFAGTTPSYLTPTQVTADLNLFTTSLQGLVPAPGSITGKFLKDDGTWASPGGGSSQTFQQTLTTGNALTKQDTVNQAGFNFIWRNGGQFQLDSLHFPKTLSISPGVSLADSLDAFGNSITFGLNATVSDSDYISRTARGMQLQLINRGVSSTITWDQVKLNLATINYPHAAFTTLMGGFNNLRNTNILTSIATRNVIVNGFKAIWLNQFATTPVSPSSGSVTRIGSGWNINWPANTEGGKLSTGAYNSVANDTLRWVSPSDSTIGIQLMAASAGNATVKIRIDGNTVFNASLNGYNDGVGNNYAPVPFIFTGLSLATHTVEIINTNGGGNLCIVDYLTTLKPAATATGLMFFEIPYMDATGYSGGQSSIPKTDTMNRIIDSLVSALPSAWPLYLVKTNNYYVATTSSGLSSDHIHPNNLGHLQISQAAAASINAAGPITDGSIAVGNNGKYYVSIGGVKQALATELSVGLQSTIINNPNITAPLVVASQNQSLNWNGFSSFGVNSGNLNVTSTNVDAHAVLRTFGASATVTVGSRSIDTTKGFDLYSPGTSFAIFDKYSGRDNINLDTSRRLIIRSTTDNTSLPTATLQIGGNSTGIAGHTPFKMNPGPLVGTKEKYAFEFDGLIWTLTDSNSVRDTIALRAWVRANFGSGSGGSNLIFKGGLQAENDTTGTIGGVLDANKMISGTNLYSFTWDSLTAFNIFKSPVNIDSFSTAIHFGKTAGGVSLLADGNIGINYGGGPISNTNLLLGANTTAVSSLMITPSSAVDVSSPNNGDIWYNSTNLYLYDGSLKQDLLNPLARYSHTISTPSTGGTVNLVNGQYNIINPSGTISTLTVNFPSSPHNNDVVWIKTTQIITTITYGNGTVVDGITTSTAGGLYSYVFNSGDSKWY